MKNIIIVGSGPAGVSASLYTKRANIETTIISKGVGVLKKAELIENFYGQNSPISGEKLHQNGIEGAKRLGVRFVEDEVVDIEYNGEFSVKCIYGEYSAPCIILATGAERQTVSIEGLSKLEGHGISYCAVCDAFFYRGKNVVVIGDGEFAASEAKYLKNIADNVTILTNGNSINVDIPNGVLQNTKKIKRFLGNSILEGIEFDDGDTIEASGAFIALGVAGTAALSKKLGVITAGKSIVTDKFGSTNVPGVYAAGDCTGGIYQISKAVYDGCIAGGSAIKYIRNISRD